MPYKLSKLNQEGTENLNRPITTHKIEVVTKKKTPNKQKFWTGWLHRWILPNIQRSDTYPSFSVTKDSREGKTLSSFYKTSIILILKPDKDTTKEKSIVPYP